MCVCARARARVNIVNLVFYKSWTVRNWFYYNVSKQSYIWLNEVIEKSSTQKVQYNTKNK